MSFRSEVVVLGAARTAIGRYGGTLRDTHPAELGARATRAALERSGVGGDAIDEVFVGHGRQAGSGPNTARQTGRRAGLPDEVPAMTVNQACASGLQAIALGAQAIQLGQSKLVLSGGIESMSRMPHSWTARTRDGATRWAISSWSMRCIGTDSSVPCPNF